MPSEKYNIAWFKLAEFVARGEKERALALYRLLVHAFDDKALAFQLEGDLLLSFNDSIASERYSIAAQIYYKEGRLIEAAAVYEHLVTLEPENAEYLLLMIQCYKALSYTSRFIKHCVALCALYAKQKKIENIITFMQTYENAWEQEEQMKIYQELIYLLGAGFANHAFLQDMLQKVVNYLASQETKELHLFLTTLENTNNNLFVQAKQLLHA